MSVDATWIDAALALYRESLGTPNKEPALAYLQAVVRHVKAKQERKQEAFE